MYTPPGNSYDTPQSSTAPKVKYPSKWTYLASNGQSKNYVDPSTIIHDGQYSMVWGKTVYDKPQRAFSGGTYRSSTSFYIFICRERKWASGSLAVYAGKELDGQRVAIQKANDASELKWIPIKPGTTADAFYEIACQENEEVVRRVIDEGSSTNATRRSVAPQRTQNRIKPFSQMTEEDKRAHMEYMKRIASPGLTEFDAMDKQTRLKMEETALAIMLEDKGRNDEKEKQIRQAMSEDARLGGTPQQRRAMVDYIIAAGAESVRVGGHDIDLSTRACKQNISGRLDTTELSTAIQYCEVWALALIVRAHDHGAITAMEEAIRRNKTSDPN